MKYASDASLVAGVLWMAGVFALVALLAALAIAARLIGAYIAESRIKHE